MKRHAIYAEGNDLYRIVSRPCGKWVLQSTLSGFISVTYNRKGDISGGTAVFGEGKICRGRGDNTYDPWRDQRRETDYETALSQLRTYENKLSRAA